MLKMVKPRIVGFLCNWCGYAGADLAGVSRFQYPPNVRIIRVMCSGRVDPVMILEAFRQGAGGVLVAGCHHGDCHYREGNYITERKVEGTKKILKLGGVEEERIALEWISATEGKKWARVVESFTEKIREIGALPKEEKEKMTLLKEVASDPTVRALIGKERELTELGNVYGEKIPEEEFDELLHETIERVYHMNKILEVIREKPRSVREISRLIRMDPERVMKLILELKRKRRVALSTIEGTPKYQYVEG